LSSIFISLQRQHCIYWL